MKRAHTVVLKKETVDLHCLIAQVIDEIYPTLFANGNQAVFTADDDLTVNGDPEKQVPPGFFKSRLALGISRIIVSSLQNDKKSSLSIYPPGFFPL